MVELDKVGVRDECGEGTIITKILDKKGLEGGREELLEGRTEGVLGFWGFGVLGFWGFGEIGRAHV